MGQRRLAWLSPDMAGLTRTLVAAGRQQHASARCPPPAGSWWMAQRLGQRLLEALMCLTLSTFASVDDARRASTSDLTKRFSDRLCILYN